MQTPRHSTAPHELRISPRHPLRPLTPLQRSTAAPLLDRFPPKLGRIYLH